MKLIVCICFAVYGGWGIFVIGGAIVIYSIYKNKKKFYIYYIFHPLFGVAVFAMLIHPWLIVARRIEG